MVAKLFGGRVVLGPQGRTTERKHETRLDFSEHKIRSKYLKTNKAVFRNVGWSVFCGPADEEGANAAAGVGAAWQEGNTRSWQRHGGLGEWKIHDGLWLG